MTREHSCPTCNTVLGPLHEAHVRRCNACNRMNPYPFNYCGFCAAPLENTKMRARLAELAAPPGGWPSLTAELVQLRFFVEQGQLQDAFELISILQKRHPGHPALTEFSRRVEPGKTDKEVGALVESLLASSPGLASKIPRRAAVQWDAPRPGSTKITDVHEIIDDFDESDDEDAPVLTPKRTHVYRALEAGGLAARSGATVVVDALQPPAPYESEWDDDVPVPTSSAVAEEVEAKTAERNSDDAPTAAGEIGDIPSAELHIEPPTTGPVEKVASKPAKKAAAKRARADVPAGPERKERRRPHGRAFGEGVLSRLGQRP